MTCSIILSTSDGVLNAQAAKLQGLGEVTAWYFGNSYEIYCALRNRTESNIRWADCGPRLTEIAERHIEHFIDIDECFEIRNCDWWDSRNIAERGPYSTSFVLECCRLLLFEDLIDNFEGPHLFVFEEADLLLTFRRVAKRKRGARVSCLTPTPPLYPKIALRQCAAAARYCVTVARRLHRIRRLRHLRKQHPIRIPDIGKCDALIAAWSTLGDFKSERKQAHSMGKLPELLRRRDLKVGFIALPLDWIGDSQGLLEEISSSKEPVIHPDDALTWLRFLRLSIESLFLFANPKQSATWTHSSISEVARLILRRERFDTRAFNARLLGEIGPFLHKIGWRSGTLVHLYENQSWEKCLRNGFRCAAATAVRVVGCLQSPFSLLYVNFWPSKQEIQTNRWPDALLVPGSYAYDQLSRFNTPADRLAIGGLLREESFVLPSHGTNKTASKRKIVCATGPDLQECCELAVKSASAVKSLDDVELIVNFHPLSPMDFRRRVQDLVQRQNLINSNVIFTDKPIKDLLADGIDAVIYADTNAAFEVVSSKGKAIHINNDYTISFDKLPEGLSRQATTDRELETLISELDRASSWPDSSTVNRTLDDCFQPVDIDAILSSLSPVGDRRDSISPISNKELPK